MSEPLWTLESVTLDRRLTDITVKIDSGTTAIVGWSGAGKTSLIHLLVGMEKPDAGRVLRGAKCFWVPQSGGLWPYVTVRDHLTLAGCRQPMELLAAFDLENLSGIRPDRVSQGEKARLAVARALAADAEVLVMDEPLAHVDPARVGKYWDVIRKSVAGKRQSLVFSTHEPQAVLGEAQNAICLKQGRVLYSGSVESLYWRPQTPELADCLGPANWFASETEASSWLGKDAPVGCLRPEQLEVVPDESGLLTVESAHFRGAVASVTLRREGDGSSRRFLHRPEGDNLRQGQRVSVTRRFS